MGNLQLLSRLVTAFSARSRGRHAGELAVEAKPAFFGRGRESALDILKKRYSRGEIGKEEFEKLRKDIE
jgi:uncharacterized membrane protein